MIRTRLIRWLAIAALLAGVLAKGSHGHEPPVAGSGHDAGGASSCSDGAGHGAPEHDHDRGDCPVCTLLKAKELFAAASGAPWSVPSRPVVIERFTSRPGLDRPPSFFGRAPPGR